MSTVLTVFGVFLVLSGTVWFLQGVNVLTVGTSPMIGQPQWAVYGAIAVVAGVLTLLRARAGRPRLK